MGLMQNIDNLSGRYYVDQIADWDEVLVGHKIVESDFEAGTITLDDGKVIKVQKNNDDCCSWVELTALRTTDHIITAVKVENTDDDEGEYKAWMQVITEGGPINVMEMDGNASNGYYLHGFALPVELVPSAGA